MTPIDISKIPTCTESELKAAFKLLEWFRARMTGNDLSLPVQRFIAERLLAGLQTAPGDEGVVP